ncbi:MAG: cysteine peptidase family C39 domain-containing protein, partial [Sediminibacterium sp.]|nr:cysteine peptidase family C39 domain-containing protein [Sediminibacterium sp.]
MLKFFHQLESIDCGPACMAMIFNYHGVNCSVKQIKNACSITRMGVSVKDIVDGANKMGFEATAVKLNVEQLTEINLPIILFWKQDHFVVLYKITSKKNQLIYHLADPGYGKIKIDSETIINEWMGTNPKGIAILMEKTDTPINLVSLPPIRFFSTDIS